MSWFFYILECGNGNLYCGITDNLDRRFQEHKSGKGGKFTRSFGAKAICFFEQFDSKSAALKREAQIKRWTREKKLALIKNDLELLKKL